MSIDVMHVFNFLFACMNVKSLGGDGVQLHSLAPSHKISNMIVTNKIDNQ